MVPDGYAPELERMELSGDELNAGAYLYVFASSFDRKVPGRPLHTNFQAQRGGEYLALVEPDGSTIATEFDSRSRRRMCLTDSRCPAATWTLVRTDALVRVQIPANGNDGTTWSTPSYRCERLAGRTMVLAMALQARSRRRSRDLMSNVNSSVYIRLPFTLTGARISRNSPCACATMMASRRS